MYATVADFVTRIGELEAIELTDAEALGVVNEEVLRVALSDAASQINGYLGRYRLPLKTVPQNLTRLCCEIARYHLTGKSGRSVTEDIETRYKLCIKELEHISKGIVSLGVDEVESTEQGENTVSFLNGGGRIFGRTRG